jgi:two-component system phosphate regulon sensor histidine kinase PhoR
MTSTRPARSERRFSVHDVLDPRWLQLGFAVAFAFAMLLLVIGGSSISSDSFLGAASFLCAAVTALTSVLPWGRLPRPCAAAVPVLDIAALGICSLDSAGWAVAPLLVLPVLWLAGTFHRLGAIGAGLAALLAWVPTTIYLGTDGGTLAWSVLVPLAVTALGLTFVEGIDRLQADREELARQRAALQVAATTIAQQHRFADAILDTVDVGLVLLDEAGAVRTVNSRHQELMAQIYPQGRDAASFAFHLDGTTLLAPEEVPERRAIDGEEFDGCLIWVGEDPLARHALSVSARSVRDDEGRLAGATLAYQDVTEFVRALRVKDEFVASVSHELRTPLTSIRGYLDLVLDQQEDVGEESRAFLRVAARNGERLQRLVADLLHTVQADAGSLHIVREPADLAAVVRDSVETAQSAAQAAGLSLSLEAPDQLWAVIDSQRMTQVVDNLVSNAIKYTQSGSVAVTLAVEDRVQIEVSDTGIGIDAMDREHLFTRFFRARHAQDQSIQGVGLGLSIIKTIVESHGGRIEVESQVGLGSRFQVRLPLELLRPDIPRPAEAPLTDGWRPNQAAARPVEVAAPEA